MKQLSNIISNLAVQSIIGNTDQFIDSIGIDSRLAAQKCLFVAINGVNSNGHLYIDGAIEKGACAIICEEFPETLHSDITYIKVSNSAIAAGLAASAFYDHPSQHLEVIGITGTNGKTTTATLLKNALQSLGFTCGLIGTVQIEIGDTIIPATHTTPDAVSAQKLLSQMLANDCSHVFMEVSSHAIDQHRISGITFKGAVFTNITHDHLDYHLTFANYIKAKKGLFDQLPSQAFALVNVDDKNGRVMVQNTIAEIKTYSLSTIAGYKARIIEQDFTGMHLEINGQRFYTTISGLFNAYNLCAAYGVLDMLGFDQNDILLALSTARGAEGRMQTVNASNGVVAVVDYAHTPDALKNVLETLNQLNNRGGNIITVIGCGGNRDKTKRPEMAKTACDLSNRVILTSDNPRNEDPEQIIAEMETGVPMHKRLNTLSITDRKNAIKTACSFAQPGDLILVAGKGHEKYQEINGDKHPFDDFKVLREYLQNNK